MEKKTRILPRAYIALWLGLLFILGGYYLLFAPRGSDYSPDENRTLAAFPELTVETLFSGKFGKDMETYLLDRFPLRNAVIKFVNKFESNLSFATHEEYLLIAEGVDDPLDDDDYQSDLDELLSNLGKPTAPPTTVPDVSVPPTTVPSTTVPEVTEPVENPPIVEKPTTSLQDFPATLGMYMNDTAVFTYSRENVAAVTAVLNKYASLLPQNGKLMFTMGPPSYMVNRFVGSQQKNNFYNTWDEVINGLSADNVYAFDSSEILSKAIKAGEYVAFRTDNHWTPYGAYLVYSQMVARAGKEVCSYEEDFEITSEEPFRGTYYRDNPTAYMNVQPDVLERLMPKTPVEYRKITGKDTYQVVPFLDFNAKQNDRYTVYLGGPGGPWRYVECDNDETENCLVVTDSFGLTVMPFLTQNYKQVHYYDARYYNQATVGYTVAEMIEKYDIHDIYVITADFHTFNSGFLISSANNQLGAQ